jgi:hypothetical protein
MPELKKRLVVCAQAASAHLLPQLYAFSNPQEAPSVLGRSLLATGRFLYGFGNIQGTPPRQGRFGKY